MAVVITQWVSHEQIIYPEINIDKLPRISGMDITFVTTAKTNEEAYELLKEMGMPFTNMEKTGSLKQKQQNKNCQIK